MPTALYDLVSRHNLAAIKDTVQNGARDALYVLLGNPEASHDEFDDAEGVENSGQGVVVEVRAGEWRVCEAWARLLCTSQAVPMHVVGRRVVSRRLCGMTVGRGMFTFGRLPPTMTDVVVVPLSVAQPMWAPRTPSSPCVDTVHVPDGANVTTWPEFHNGVPAGVRVMPGTTRLTRSWVRQHKAEAPSHAHAGVMQGGGLGWRAPWAWATSPCPTCTTTCPRATGGRRWASSWASPPGNVPHSTLVCARRCGCTSVAMLASAFADMPVEALVECVALVGVGLLYQATADRLMTDLVVGGGHWAAAPQALL